MTPENMNLFSWLLFAFPLVDLVILPLRLGKKYTHTWSIVDVFTDILTMGIILKAFNFI